MDKNGGYLEYDGDKVPVYFEGNSLFLDPEYIGEPALQALVAEPGAAAVDEQASGLEADAAAVPRALAPVAADASEEVGAPAVVGPFGLELTDMPPNFRPSLTRGASNKQLQTRLKELDQPVYGTKRQMWSRLYKAELAEKNKRDMDS